MPMKVLEECINCGACEPVCPNSAVAAGEPIYVVDPERCTECVGFFDSAQCVKVCPVDCIIVDLDNPVDQETLLTRARAMGAPN